ncbi:MAG: rRNA maturation RNase YbeY [Silicimonas sp.]|nr:rRNA maturation RNase YbeY [Silicimonas sp.]
MAVDVIIEDERWEAAGLETWAVEAVAGALAHLGLEVARYDVAVLGCDDDRIAALNAEFRGKGRATNVLSWPTEERAAETAGEVPGPPGAAPELGDIAVAYETCLDEARGGGKPLRDHAMHLIVHGTLHLLGYDHQRDGDGDLMEAAEIAILGRLGVANPYEGFGAAGRIDDGKD